MKMAQQFGQRIFFLFLLPLFFVLHGYRQNREAMHLGEAFALFLWFSVAAVVITAFFFLLFRSWRKAALFAFFLLCFYLFFGVLHDGLKNIFGSGFFSQYSFVVPAGAIALELLFLFLKRTERTLRRTVVYLNVLFLLLILIEIPYLLQPKKTAFASLPGTFICDTCQKPDIYFIIADEYADSTSLQQVFDFNNHSFQDQLRQRGFHVVQNSRSNYNFTPFSVASILQLNYLTGIEGKNQSQHDKNRCYDLINRSGLWTYLQKNGYEIKNHSVFNVANIPTQAPQNYIRIGKDVLLAQTFWGRFDRDLRFHLADDLGIQSEIDRYIYFMQRCNERLLDGLRQETEQTSSKPKFVYAHLTMPHYPYYFRKDGKPNPPQILTEGNQIRKQEYIEYLQWSNVVFLKEIDRILRTAKKPPVIVFMGDHGFREFAAADFEKMAPYYYMNLNAVFLPSKDYTQFFEGISGVNQFRAVLNTVFAQKLPFLRDSTILLHE